MVECMSQWMSYLPAPVTHLTYFFKFIYFILLKFYFIVFAESGPRVYIIICHQATFYSDEDRQRKQNTPQHQSFSRCHTFMLCQDLNLGHVPTKAHANPSELSPAPATLCLKVIITLQMIKVRLKGWFA